MGSASNSNSNTATPVADPLPSVVERETETGLLRVPVSWAHTVTWLALSTVEKSSCSNPMLTTGCVREREREREREGVILRTHAVYQFEPTVIILNSDHCCVVLSNPHSTVMSTSR